MDGEQLNRTVDACRALIEARFPQGDERGAAVHGPDVLVGVAGRENPTRVVWKPLREVLPDYWMTVFPGEVTGGW